MTRRDFVWMAAAANTAGPAAPGALIVPLNRVRDRRAKCTPKQLQNFSSSIWPEAVRDFQRGGIQFQITDTEGEIRRSPGGRPLFAGLQRGAINLVLTDHIPKDYGALAGVTTLSEGYTLCVIALSEAHGHQIPYFSVNTCVHELLHALLQDIFLSHPKWYQEGEREFRIDWYATRLWLFGDGTQIRKSAQGFLTRLRSESPHA